jgi:hypothetical protein
MALQRVIASCLASGLGVFCLMGSVASIAADKPDAAVDAAPAGLVHCLLPGQVRRLGAFSTSVMPRKAVRNTPAQCKAGGGEYVEPQDQTAAIKMWLPMAAEGIPEAQTTVGELFEQRGDKAMAKSWYEKAAAQGDTRSLINLAGFLEKSVMLAGNKAVGSMETLNRVSQLVNQATGGLVTGLSLQRSDKLRVDFVSPVGASPVPHAAGGPVVLESAAGPLDVIVRVAGSAGLKSVRVNGQAQTPDAQGLLNIPVTVTDARTVVLVQAEDDTGAQAQSELTLVQRSAPLAASAAASAVSASTSVLTGAQAVPLLPGKRFALVVANQQYRHWPKLDTPRADAQAVANVLKQRFGFEVTLLQDVTRQQLLSALNKLRQQVGPQDQVVVYYAGHGQMDSITARGYWIPVDGDEKDLAQWVSVIDVTDQLSAMTARHVLVIADSCYSGTLTRSLVPAVDQALTLEQRSSPLKQLSKQRARVAMTSGGLEPVVDGGSIEHSLFARSLLDVLSQVSSPVAAQELYQSVSARFAHLARRLKIEQKPQYAPIGFAGHEAGDFVFSPI